MSKLAAVVAELKQRKAWERAIRAEMFDKQLDLHDDTAQFKATHTGRRGGKSEGMPRSSVLDILKAGRGQTVLLGAETLKKAKSLHWNKVIEVSNKHNVPLKPDGNDSSWSAPWGAHLRFWGCSDPGAIELARGFDVYAARFDEVASYARLLPNLVESVLEPALGQSGGQLTLYGTPSFTRAGPWFDICVGEKKRKWSVHHWDARSNPFFRPERGGAVQWFREVLESNGWDWDNATFQREYLGLFVNDSDAQVYRYVSEINDVKPADLLNGRPKHWDRDKWAHVVSLDFGVVDDCSFTTTGSAPHEKNIYTLESFKRDRLLVDEAASIAADVCNRFRPFILVGDTGGLGKPYAEEWNRRYAGRELVPGYTLPPMVSADKLGKRANIDIVNTEFRTGRLRIVRESCQELVEELESLPWADEQRLKEHPAYSNHCCDGLLYGALKHHAYLNEPKAASKPRPLPDSQARIEQEERELIPSSDRGDWWEQG